ncbi:5-hydroxytryptamine receptor 7-like [Paramacrobiotus metropolitanus]|uniref:5-hydroxytryptamine receptor 7-like n=1 Tax=Paramacrobiotus metropolitanus TaxID=2943436 RepID=UPI0024458A22|nr:5-hydroxytryptamine receptor 7-like [Paramacrobiotus metropolitanus]
MNISAIQANLSQSFRSRRPELVTLVSVFTVAGVTGVVLSSSLVLTIVTRPKLRTGSGILIAHQQLLHVLQTGVSNPFYIVVGWAVWLGGVSITGIDCTIAHFFCQVFICVETWSSVFLAVNRFVALIYPHQYRHISSNAAVAGFIVAAWCISAAIEIPALLGIGSYFGMRQFDCGYIRVTDHNIVAMHGVVGIYFPLGLQAFLYAAILINHRQKDQGGRVTRVQKKRFELFRLLFSSYLWYVACYLPFMVTIYGLPRFFFADKLRAGWFLTMQEIGYAGSPV